ncbi:MAG: SgcJ/EcaC family oxidoreductase [Acidobacteriia bacterium]|nr:SgcJ/EcaC family oxidoreductase [Terriglobia bacterium]
MNTQEEDGSAIREIETEAKKAAAARNLERYISFYADDASLFWPGTPMVTGKPAIRELMNTFFAMPSFSLSFQTVKVQVSQSGDLAYSYGINTVTLTDPNGNVVSDKGKYLTVYKKQLDGKWKVIADIGNSDLQAPMPQEK